MIQVIDTETTGVDPAKDAVVELAVVPVFRPGGVRHDSQPEWEMGAHFTSLVDPGRPIPPEASAVHHLRDQDVAGLPSLAAAWDQEWSPPDFYAAHNAKFDREMLEAGLSIKFETPWICTWRCALHLYPDAPSHSNQCLRYYLSLDEQVRDLLEEYQCDWAPHRALYDAVTTANILVHMLNGRTPQQLVDLTTAPVLLTKVRFGKHQGQPWASVPRDYLQWILRQGDFDPDVQHTARHYLGA